VCVWGGGGEGGLITVTSTALAVGVTAWRRGMTSTADAVDVTTANHEHRTLRMMLSVALLQGLRLAVLLGAELRPIDPV